MAEAKTKNAAQKAAPKVAAAPKKSTASKTAEKSTAAPPKAAAPKKSAAPRKAAAPKPAKKLKPGPEELYRMIQTAAYFIAERNGFAGDSKSYWAQAEAQILTILK